MATKLKNWIRLWFVKVMLFLVILSTGTAMIINTWHFSFSGNTVDFKMDYEGSDAYYNDLNNYYHMVYKTYFSSGLPKDTVSLDSKEGYYYFIKYDSTTGFTNAPESQEQSGLPKINQKESDFYSAIASLQRIDQDMAPLYTGTGTFFTLIPKENTYILVGIDQETLNKRNDEHLTLWKQRNLSLVSTYLVGGLVIISAMILLALGAGRKPYSDDLHFNLLDRIWGDFYLVFWVLAEVAMIGLAGELTQVLGQTSILPSVIVVANISGLIGLIYWMSTWKRLKGKCLLKQSFVGLIWLATFGRLIRWFVEGVKAIKNGPFYGLPLLISLGFLAMNAITILIGGFLTAALGFFGFLLGSSIYLGGVGLVAIYLIYQDQQIDLTLNGLARIKAGDLDHKIKLRGTKPFLSLADGINDVTEGLKAAVSHEIKSERMKAELITNVSHDLKTPLTSIINYVDLLKTEGLSSPEAPHYLEVLDQKSQRLKQLTEDLFEAAKASSGNILVETGEIGLKEFLHQALAEYQDRFDAGHLELRLSIKEDLNVLADGRHLWRVLDNLLNKALKYDAPHSRVYIEAQRMGSMAEISIKNISAEALNMPAEELKERFKRGDESRTTEGSGLGLSIAEGLMQHQGGQFNISIDGDLFKVVLTLPLSV